jgi:hypothetical protein
MTDRTDRTDRETLAAALRRAADTLATEAPPATAWDDLRARLRPPAPVLQAVPATPAAALRPARRRWPVALGTGALLLASLLLMRPPAPVPVSAEASPFVPVAARDSWPAPGAAWLVRAELPRERLAEFGLPFDPTRAAERVPAQLLLRPDGAVLAVRVLARDGAQ